MKFKFTYTCEVEVDDVDLWPDADGPPTPTEKDVADLVLQDGGPTKVLTTWNLKRDLSLTITDLETGEQHTVLENG